MSRVGALFTVIIKTTILFPTFAAPSIYLLSGEVSVKDMLFIDDFILIVVIQRDYYTVLVQCSNDVYMVFTK